jgi:Na+/melibiose symporter-like transporter
VLHFPDAPSTGGTLGNPIESFAVRVTKKHNVQLGPAKGDKTMSLGLILVIILVIFLVGGFSGRFGGYGYGYGHGGIGVIGIILIVLVVLLLMGRL